MRRRSKAKKFCHSKSKAELEDALRSQLANMRRSFVAFDNGAMEEGARIASAIYIICYEGSASKAVLAQLGVKDAIRIPDSSSRPLADPEIVHVGLPLADAVWENGSVAYVPRRGDPATMTKLPFSKWWNQTVFVSARTGQNLSRKNLVNHLRSKDGGGHVDGFIDNETYFGFSREGDHTSWNLNKTLGVNAFKDYDGRPLAKNGHLITVRQIGWELEEGLSQLGY